MSEKRSEGMGLTVLGWLSAIGGILVVVNGWFESHMTQVGVGLGSIVSGVVLIGFGRALELLGEIADAVERPITLQAAQYFFEVAGEVRGPVPLNRLLLMRALPSELRQVNGDTLVCKDGEKAWYPLKLVEDFE